VSYPSSDEGALFGLELPGFQLSYIRGVPADILMRCMGAEQPASSGSTLDLWESQKLVPSDPDGAVVRVTELGEWSLCFEAWGAAPICQNLLSGISQQSEAVLYHNGGTGMDTVWRWESGNLVEVFEVLNPSSLRAYTRRTLWDSAQRHAVRVDDRDSATLQAIHEYIGHTPSTELLVGPMRTAWVPYSALPERVDEVFPPRVPPQKHTDPRELNN
jgi:hypothetical protein